MMKQRALWMFKTLMLATLLGLAKPVGADEPKVIVSLPLHVSMVLPIGETKLMEINTFTGSVQTIVQNQGGVDTPLWDSSGEYIAYASINDSTILNLRTGHTETIETFSGQNDENLFYPAGWSADGKTLLEMGIVVNYPYSVFDLYLMNVETRVLSPLRAFVGGEAINDIAPPSGVNAYIMHGLSEVIRNPVYDEWVALQLEAEDLEASTAETVATFYINVLWNYQSNQIIFLDGLFDSKNNSTPLIWKSSGDKLLVNTYDKLHTYVNIVHFDPSGDVQLTDTAQTDRIMEDWLDAGDLIIAEKRDEAANDYVYYIAEIIDNTWHETEFLRLDADQEFAITLRGDWHITASDEEKQALACLFGHAPDGGTCDAQQ